jgi:hypothetical protein
MTWRALFGRPWTEEEKEEAQLNRDNAEQASHTDRLIKENEGLKMARVKLVIGKMFASHLTGAWRQGRVVTPNTPQKHP